MNIMYLLIGTSLILAIGFLLAFIWSVRSGQMDDDYTPSVRMLFDNTTPQKSKVANEKEPVTSEKSD